MLQRLMIRANEDYSHVICAVEQNNTHKVVRIELCADQPGRVEVKDLYVLNSGRIAGLTKDPENAKYLFLVDDFQNLVQISD